MLLKFINNHKKTLLIAHAVIGFFGQIPFFTRLLGLVVIGYGIVSIINSKNRNEEASLFAAYIAGAEVFLRMTRGLVLYETGKYAVFIFLLLGLIVGRNTNRPNPIFIFYILLLLIGVAFTSIPSGASLRNNVVFNLSGPILLGFCSFYYYYRSVDRDTLFNMLFLMLLPIISMASYLYFRTPSIEEIVFGSVANFDASGGFGPNQVATMLGVGIFIVTVFLISKRRLTGNVFADGIILIYLTYRGLLTFSRGGIITAAIALLFFLIYYFLSEKRSLAFVVKVLGVFFFAIVAIWLYTSNITGGMLDNRYAGKNAAGIQKKDITSGRLNILREQLNSFYESPIFGIGVGNGKYKRIYSGRKVTAASHNEVGRLLEEHGTIGLISLFILIGIPALLFFNVDYYQKAFIISFFLLWLLTISHSAMRIAFTSFIYSLCLLNLRPNEE